MLEEKIISKNLFYIKIQKYALHHPDYEASARLISRVQKRRFPNVRSLMHFSRFDGFSKIAATSRG